MKGTNLEARIAKDNRNLQIINLAVSSLHSTAKILSRKENQIIHFGLEGYDLTRD